MNYEEFERDWIKRHKASVPRLQRTSSLGITLGLILWAIIALGAAAVSGAHSVPAILKTIPQVVPSPHREFLSLSGFTIFELFIFAGAFYRKQSRYAAGGLILSFVGALAANVGSSVLAVEEHSGTSLDMIVSIVLACIAPSAAFLAGEMFSKILASHNEILEKAKNTYDEKRKNLDVIINREWQRSQKRSGSVQLNDDPISIGSLLNAGERSLSDGLNDVGRSLKETVNVKRSVIEWFEQRPEYLNEDEYSATQLHDLFEQQTGIAVGRTTAYNVRRELNGK